MGISEKLSDNFVIFEKKNNILVMSDGMWYNVIGRQTCSYNERKPHELVACGVFYAVVEGWLSPQAGYL